MFYVVCGVWPSVLIATTCAVRCLTSTSVDDDDTCGLRGRVCYRTSCWIGQLNTIGVDHKVMIYRVTNKYCYGMNVIITLLYLPTLAEDSAR